MAKNRAIDLEPIDRLEEKIKRLVAALDQLRSDHARMAEENGQLAQETEQLRGHLADVEGNGLELRALKEERDEIRTRVAEMLEQIEALNL